MPEVLTENVAASHRLKLSRLQQETDSDRARRRSGILEGQGQQLALENVGAEKGSDLHRQ